MEMSQGNSVYSYLTQTTVFFLLLKKWENQRVEQVLSGRMVPGTGEDIRKVCRRVNIVQILYTHLPKWKMVSVETIAGKEVGE
jgi:hypothetical protein